MNFNIREILSAAIVLAAVMDIIGSLPIVLAMRERGLKVNPLQTTVVTISLLIAFLFLGQSFLGFFGVDINSFAVAGAIVLFVISLEMVMGVEIMKQDGPKGASIVPLAFPLLAGPGSFTTLLSLRAEYGLENIIAAVLLNALFVYFVLRASSWIQRIAGTNGIYVLKKLFGIILLAMSVKLFTSNLSVIVHTFTSAAD